MEGSLQEYKGRFAVEAGMIPRALYSLFDILDGGGTEYTVKVSCIELYNEELQDLLTPGEDLRKLRVYEDKKGVNIQGVEEVNVTSASDVLTVLQKANLKRQNASTFLNEHSSRSHGVYTITVFTKEMTPGGEELLKTGKLNLVDLAGSENIGRSGAENKRAREAGMINQSLLTLGRVINALVEKSPHIPYRESKLTRLLQDSLGGRTKTCIIATISPARCNLEETQSTLDYAHRAKNIRNRPEVNQRMTKRALLSTYTVEIERLRSDLQASREKNGVYLSPERFNELTETMEAQRLALEHLKSEIETHERLLETEKSLHLKCRVQWDQTKTALQQARTLIEDQQLQLQLLRKRAKEDEMLFNIMSHRDTTLRDLTITTIENLKAASSDVHELHDALGSTRSLLHENKSVVQSYQDELKSEISQLSNTLTQFDEVQSLTSTKIESNLASLSNIYNNFLSSTSENHQQFLALIRDRFQKINTQLKDYEALPTFTSLQSHLSNLQTDLLNELESLVSQSQVWSQNVHQQVKQNVGDIQTSYDHFQSKLMTSFSGFRTHFELQHTELNKLLSTFAHFKSELQEKLSQRQKDSTAHFELQKAEHQKRLHQLIEKITQLVHAHANVYAADLENQLRTSDQQQQHFSTQITDLLDTSVHAINQVSEKEQSQTLQLDNETSMVLSNMDQLKTQVSKLSSFLVQRVDSQQQNLATRKDHALIQLESLVQHGHGQLGLALDQRDALLSGVQTHLEELEHRVYTETEKLNQYALETQASVVQSFEGCQPKPLSRQCKSLIESLTHHATEIEQSALHLAKKRLRDSDDLPIPSKKRYVIPELNDLPPPCQRDVLLENHERELETKNIQINKK
ncbi:hypothetical protein HMI55_000851 [Coelomomyces lativittatus]|nr:hypothetical protein HMI56_006213 [Coelomomyces lativittatus]KAJ1517014.1 hypothetical protein HMI55_000851 [Coelomomyces lativittatus]